MTLKTIAAIVGVVIATACTTMPILSWPADAGRNAFTIDGELRKELTRCTCSFCSKRGHLYAYFHPEQFKPEVADSDAVYRWNSKAVANHFCSACGCDVYADSPDFKPDGSWDGVTRRIAVNARLLDDFEAADWPVGVLNGKHLW
jgi:hypothetical protein